tara:strand:- start:2182 stop:3414 length:1233 start_codon:yes stop_codon:yes gene_type:complete
MICQRCFYTTDHPLGLTIDNEGICSGCRIHEEKDQIDWQAKWRRLEEIVKPYRSIDRRNYDCIVPVTGGNDSYFIVHLVKNVLKLNPLLVSYNSYFNTPLGIRNLSNMRIKFNCDIIIQNVNPISLKKITRTTLRRFGSIYWSVIAGKTVFPVQTAVRYKIPLIIWGAHQGLEQVGMFSHFHEVEMTRRYRKDHDLMGYEAEDLLSVDDVLTEEDVWQYKYPDDFTLNQIGVRGIYLGNYKRWDPKSQHEKMIKEYGYKTSSFSRSFDCYDYVHCYNYMGLHDLLKLYKHGYSKVTDHVVREIRHRRLNRKDGLKLVMKYEQGRLLYPELFCKWLGITNNGLQFLMDQHRNQKYWHSEKPGSWRLKKTEHLNNNINQSSAESKDKINFICNSNLDNNENPAYIVIGKGYP